MIDVRGRTAPVWSWLEKHLAGGLAGFQEPVRLGCIGQGEGPRYGNRQLAGRDPADELLQRSDGDWESRLEPGAEIEAEDRLVGRRVVKLAGARVMNLQVTGLERAQTRH